MPENIHKSDDYISVGSIKNIVLDFFRFLFRAIDFILLPIRRRLGLFLFCCLVGITGGYLYYWQNPPYYKTEMIVKSNDLTRKAFYEILANLNYLITSQSHSAFSAQLKLDPRLGKDVLAINAVDINNATLQTDTSTKTGQLFKIQLKASDISSIPILQDALINYLKNSPYLQLLKDGDKRIYTEKLKFIDYEQKKLDSLISDYHAAVTEMKMPTTIYNNAIDPASLYQHALKLDSVREKTQRWLNSESEAILLIDGFKSPANPQSISLIVALLMGLTGGVLLGGVVVILAVLKNALI